MAAKMDIEKSKYHEFLTMWNFNMFKGQRFGQAFYNHFALHRLRDQERLENLYEADGNEAHWIIGNNFRFV